MADVSIKYKGVEKATLNASGSKTIKTSGKYCEADIFVEYTDPQKAEQSKSMTLGASAPSTVTPDSGKVLSSVSPSIDSSVIKAENIKSGVQMLGITGTHQGGITPSGTKSITENGTYDVTNYASANVSVPSPNCINLEVTLASDQTGYVKVLSGNPTIASHYADDNAVCTLSPAFSVSGNSLVVCYTTMNRGSSGLCSMCLITGSSGSSSIVAQQRNFKNTVGTSSLGLYGTSNGDVYIYSATRALKAGTYHLTFSW